MSDLDTIDDALDAIKNGEMVVVVDDDDRENEGDLVMAASKATAKQIAFMIRHTSGILCAPLASHVARRLRLDPMVSANDAPLHTAFTVSVDYRYGTTTGISAEERTTTLRALANGNVGAEDFVRPGHVFPLVSRDGGVLVRSGHTEAATDLTTLAGLEPVGVLAELVDDDGTVKRLPRLLAFAKEHGLKIVSIADLIDYRQRRENLVKRIAEYDIATSAGDARAIVYATPFDPVQHIAIVFGELSDGENVLVRIHREQLVLDLFGEEGSSRGDALERLAREGRGVYVHIRDGVVAQPAQAPSEPALNVFESGEDEGHAAAEERRRRWREIGLGAQILRDLNLRSIRLLASEHRHYVGLAGFGVDIAETELL